MARSSRKNQQNSVKKIALLIAEFMVLIGGIILIGALAGWFSDTAKITLDSSYYTNQTNLVDLSAAEYDDLISQQKSFLIFVDQAGCHTADRLESFVRIYLTDDYIMVYRMDFSVLKTTSLYDKVKYYPSFVIIDQGAVKGFLRADSDDDAPAYNNYDDFVTWLSRYLIKS